MSNIDRNVTFGSKFCSDLGPNYCDTAFSLSLFRISVSN